MAYAAVRTITNLGNGDWQVTIAETEAGVATETSFLMPLSMKSWRLRRSQCYRAAGTGTTVQPTLGSSTNPVTAHTIERQATRNPQVDEQYVIPVVCRTDASGYFFHRTLLDAGADNTVTTIYRFSEVWDD